MNIFDTINTENGQLGDIYTLDQLRQTGDDLLKLYDYLTPISQPLRFHIPLPIGINQRPSKLSAINLFTAAKDNQQWRTFMLGGIEFPTINYAFSGKKHDHFWGVGFGAIFQDRIYHVQFSTLERWVWKVQGYHPSEPVFIQDPNSDNESDGILLSLVSPMADPDLKVTS